MLHATHAQLDRGSLGRRELSERRALQYSGLLLADREIAERLLRGDRATRSEIRDRAETVDELLVYIAEVADGALPAS
jgi:hypothetical protein